MFNFREKLEEIKKVKENDQIGYEAEKVLNKIIEYFTSLNYIKKGTINSIHFHFDQQENKIKVLINNKNIIIYYSYNEFRLEKVIFERIRYILKSDKNNKFFISEPNHFAIKF